MKEFKTFALALIAIIAAGFTLTSCDDDYFQANQLDGEWRGDFGMYYTDNRGYEWDASYSIIEFYQNGFSSYGSGKQYDYYARGPIEWEYYTFNWSIKNGVIHLSYPYNHNLDTSIYDYRMSRSYFSGYFGATNSYFRLDKYRDWNWSSYDGDYCYYDRYYDYYYAKTRSASPTDSTAAESQQPHERTNPAVKHGNRNNEKAKN